MRQTWLKLVALAIATFYVVPVAYAGNGEHGRYLGLRFIGSVAEIQDTTATNFNGTLQINHDDDLVAGNSVILGYRWKSIPIRTEIEVGVRYRFDYDHRDTGAPVTGYENNLSTVTGLVNIAYEYRNSSNFTPYFGGSLGWAQQNSEVTRNNLVARQVEKFSGDSHNFAWGGIVGVTWNFSKHWDTDFGYRFVNLGNVDTGVSSVGTRLEGEDYLSHDVLFTVNYRF